MRTILKILLLALFAACATNPPAALALTITSGQPDGAASTPAQPPARPPITVSPGIVSDLLAKAPAPIYPQEAKDKKLQGTVLLHAIIGADGSVSDVKMVSASDPIFVDAAIAAVSKWHYRPYSLNGVAIPVQTNITVNFKMKK